MRSNRGWAANRARWALTLIAASCGESAPGGSSKFDDRPPTTDLQVTLTTALGGDECGAECLEGYHTFADRYADHVVPIDFFDRYLRRP